MIEKFTDFLLHTGPEDILDPIQELRSFGTCEVEKVVNLGDLRRNIVCLNWPYLAERHRVHLHIYSKQGKYKEGDNVQVIEARRGPNRYKEEFTTTLSNPLMGDLLTLTHDYLARRMEKETDILKDHDLNPVNNKIVSELDPVIVGRLE